MGVKELKGVGWANRVVGVKSMGVQGYSGAEVGMILGMWGCREMGR